MKVYREILRSEMKATAYYRKVSKDRAKTLQVEASKEINLLNISLLNEDSGDYFSTRQKRINALYESAGALQISKSSYARSLNIASGLIKGLDYRKIEARSKTSPCAEQILSIIKSYTPYPSRKEWNLEKVKKLLK